MKSRKSREWFALEEDSPWWNLAYLGPGAGVAVAIVMLMPSLMTKYVNGAEPKTDDFWPVLLIGPIAALFLGLAWLGGWITRPREPTETNPERT